MKKFLALLLALVMVLGLGACAFDIGDNSGFGGSKTPAASNTPVVPDQNDSTPVATSANPTELTEEVLKGTWSAQIPFEILATLYVVQDAVIVGMDTIPEGMECLLVFDGEDCSLLMDYARSEELQREIIEAVYTEDVMYWHCFYTGGLSKEELYSILEYYDVHSMKEAIEIEKQLRLDELDNEEEWDGEMWGEYAVMPFDSWRIADNKLYVPSEYEDYGAFFEYDGETLTIPAEDIFFDLNCWGDLTFTKISNKTDY